MADVLIVDDEPNILTSLEKALTDEGFQIVTASSGTEALEKARQDPPVVVLLDILMPGLDGLEVLTRLRTLAPRTLVIMMSAHGTIETAVRATKLGAYDFLEKPFSSEKVTLLIRHAVEARRLEEENRSLREQIASRDEMIGESPAIQALREQIRTAGPTNSRVLITGENGTGKELVARAVHAQSPRAERPFIAVNCAALPETLIESELFGYEKGAFTGATAARRGRFELADGGTLFLDEIGDMSQETQAKVLRALEGQGQRFYRVGGTRVVAVDVRVLAASNKNLEEAISRGVFREDLYYRLNVLHLHVPPLRERQEDIPRLVAYFLDRLARDQGLRPKEIAPEALTALGAYTWPGNIRELRNLIERLMIMVPGPTIQVPDIQINLQMDPSRRQALGEGLDLPPDGSLRAAREAFERDYIARRLQEHRGNVSKAAAALGIERSHLHRKLKALGIGVPRGPDGRR